MLGLDERHRVCWPVTHRSACLAVVTTARGGPDAASTARGGRCPSMSEGGGERRMVLAAAAREDGQAGKIGHSGEDESRPRALDAAGQVIATRMPGAAVRPGRTR